MKKAQEIDVKGTFVRIVKFGAEDYVCITDMAKSKSDDAQQTISNWMRNRMTIEYLGLWEELYNPDFKPLEFEGFRKEVGLNSFEASCISVGRFDPDSDVKRCKHGFTRIGTDCGDGDCPCRGVEA